MNIIYIMVKTLTRIPFIPLILALLILEILYRIIKFILLGAYIPLAVLFPVTWRTVEYNIRRIFK